MCSECNYREKFDTILGMAFKCLPTEKHNLDAIVSECELRWKAVVDAELASSIITGFTAKELEAKNSSFPKETTE